MSKHQTTAYKSDSSVQNKRETQSHKFTQPSVVRSETKSHHKTKKPVQRQILSGPRRIWGTLRSATHNTIVHLTKIEARALHVKRKFRTSRPGQHRWWFVLHGEENIMKVIENAWEKGSLQTSWRLETCTKPVDEFDVTLHMPNYSHNNVDDTV